jgi:hypothetical protein
MTSDTLLKIERILRSQDRERLQRRIAGLEERNAQLCRLLGKDPDWIVPPTPPLPSGYIDRPKQMKISESPREIRYWKKLRAQWKRESADADRKYNFACKSEMG